MAADVGEAFVAAILVVAGVVVLSRSGGLLVAARLRWTLVVSFGDGESALHVTDAVVAADLVVAGGGSFFPFRGIYGSFILFRRILDWSMNSSRSFEDS